MFRSPERSPLRRRNDRRSPLPGRRCRAGALGVRDARIATTNHAAAVVSILPGVAVALPIVPGGVRGDSVRPGRGGRRARQRCDCEWPELPKALRGWEWPELWTILLDTRPAGRRALGGGDVLVRSDRARIRARCARCDRAVEQSESVQLRALVRPPGPRRRPPATVRAGHRGQSSRGAGSRCSVPQPLQLSDCFRVQRLVGPRAAAPGLRIALVACSCAGARGCCSISVTWLRRWRSRPGAPAPGAPAARCQRRCRQIGGIADGRSVARSAHVSPVASDSSASNFS